ncbi:hypothetical protein, variant [Aphanomyces invadans]|uniref:Uncharacterized protein n=1 Tax=Aphanomyces invadans TaxID=157072 RepID=A0A024U2L7_9STRA|nr:hypothetical protein, variant [Aphanomyces invadans]ETV99852.1 hypothetical protein, variant [Aphanomyces invadans]|eukprot:XP_008871628.1 hypothetical protein, variant [Aphanomyces invadans]
MEQYQHNGRKLIQMLFKNTEKGASAGPPVMTLPTKPTHAHPPSKLFPPVVSVPPSSRIGPETPTSPDPPSPLQWTPPHSTGPRFALVKPTKKVKRAPARIPPLDVAPSTPGPSRHSNNHAEADLASATEGGNPAPVLESDLDILAADDVTVEDMNRVIDDLKQWRADHAHKMATQFSGASSSSQSTDDDDATARQLAAMEAEDDADHKELMQLYEQAKARWSTSSRPKDWGISTKGPPPTPEVRSPALMLLPFNDSGRGRRHAQ